MGPGPVEYLLPAALAAIREADLLAGAGRHLESFSHLGKETLVIEGDFTEAAEEIGRKRMHKKVAVLVSGDPCLFSFLGLLRRKPVFEDVEVAPGLSSFQLLAAKARFMWNDAKIITFFITQVNIN